MNVFMTMLTSGYGEVSGYVLDAMEQTPLPGATITIENTVLLQLQMKAEYIPFLTFL